MGLFIYLFVSLYRLSVVSVQEMNLNDKTVIIVKNHISAQTETVISFP